MRSKTPQVFYRENAENTVLEGTTGITDEIGLIEDIRKVRLR
jgi:hypothetical protein